MTQDEIVEMARQAGFYVADQFAAAGTYQDMTAFAKLVASKEREACAKICGEYNFAQTPKMIQEAIRARNLD
jgi:hypothetical protein